MIQATFGSDIQLAVIPVERFDPDWVREVNRGRDILFVADLAALESRLDAEKPGS